MKSRYTLVGLDIEGQWNLPLLQNAADMSGASRLLARSTVSTASVGGSPDALPAIDELLGQFDHVLACELTASSRSVYMLSFCREIYPEDGVDPRDLPREGRSPKVDRKVRQLCSQVAETLNQVLSGECADELLQSL